MIKKIPALLPGVVLALGIAVIAKLAEILETNAGLHLIAYERPMELGYDKIVLVLTREQGYRKHQEGRWMKRAYDRYFAPLPSLRQSLRDIPERYNRIQEELDRLEAEGRIFIIRPDHPVEVSRLEQDVHKIQALYDEGRRIALEQLPALKNYLELPQ